MRNVFYVLLFGALIGLFYYSYEDSKSEKNNLFKTGKLAVGTIYLNGGSLLCKYVVKGTEYQGNFGKPCPLENGEKFNILYDPELPESFWILFERPVIGNDFITVSGVPIKVVEDNYIKFSYTVESKKHIRFQKIPPTVQVDFAKRYPVKFDSANPKIAYIVW